MPTTTMLGIKGLGAATGALLLLTLTACGGSASSNDSSTATARSSAATSDPGQAGTQPDFAAYRDCMTQNGVTLPDRGQGGPPAGGFPSGAPSGMPTGAPPFGGPGGQGGFTLPDGVDQATFDKAQTACASLRPNFGAGGGGPAFDQTAVAAFKSCLGDHEVKVPDGDNWMTQLDRSDPTVKAAMETCAPLLPQPSASQ